MARAARFIYGACIILAFLLSLVALFTPGWRSYKGSGAPDQGIVTYNCGFGNRQVAAWDCWKWASSKQTFEKVTLALMVIGVLLEAFAVGCFFGMFNRRVKLHLPATTAAFTAFVCLLVAVIVYGSGIYSKVAYMYSVTFELLADVVLGYSFYLAIAATILLFIGSMSAFGMFGDSEAER